MQDRAVSRGVVSLVFDDGYQDVFDHVLPLLRQRGIRATFAIPVDTERVARTEQAALASLETWKDVCHRDGHELAAHGVTHRPLTELDDVELERELRESQTATGATTLVYPGGAFDERVKQAATTVFRAARTTAWGVENLPPHDPYALRTLNATSKNFRRWKFQARELQALLVGQWVIETFHRVTAHPVHPHDVSLDDFSQHLSWLCRLPIRIATICDVMHDRAPLPTFAPPHNGNIP